MEGRTTRVTHPSKTKGNAYERELVNQAKDSGLPMRSVLTPATASRLGECEEVDVLVGGRRVQAKRRKKLPASLTTGDYRLSEGVDAVVARGDGGDSIVILRWWDYLDLLATKTTDAPRSSVCHIRDVGSCELTFQTSVMADEVQGIMMESGRIFRFQLESWDGERAEIRLVPDKGIVRIQSGITKDVKNGES